MVIVSVLDYRGMLKVLRYSYLFYFFLGEGKIGWRCMGL